MGRLSTTECTYLPTYLLCTFTSGGTPLPEVTGMARARGVGMWFIEELKEKKVEVSVSFNCAIR